MKYDIKSLTDYIIIIYKNDSYTQSTGENLIFIK